MMQMTNLEKFYMYTDRCEDILWEIHGTSKQTTLAEYEELYEALLGCQDDIALTLVNLGAKDPRLIRMVASMGLLTVPKGKYKRKATLIDYCSGLFDIKADACLFLTDRVFGQSVSGNDEFGH